MDDMVAGKSCKYSSARSIMYVQTGGLQGMRERDSKRRTKNWEERINNNYNMFRLQM